MISVTRKSHIPSVEASFCCAAVSKWCSSAAGWPECSCVLMLDKFLLTRVRVSRLGDDWHHLIISRRRWRAGLPLKALCSPWIGCSHFAPFQRPNEIGHRQQVAERQDRSARRGHHVQNLELFGVGVIAPGHPQVAEQKLREERQVES